jgi:replicative DNA helicase
LDKQGIVQEGEIVSYIGRPQAGKSWLTLYGALHNFKRKLDPGVKRRNVLFVSMEMMTVPILQRLSSMYTGCPISDLKSGFSSDTYLKFDMTLEFMSKEENRMYVVDGNLAASVEDIYSLADSLNCSTIYVDGAYLLRHKNIKLDRFTRAAENIELMKRYTTDLGMVTFSSWQFNREATKKKGKGNEDAGLEDIGYSDAIGQISSVVLGLFIDDSAESVGKRNVRVLKGRNGEVGQFSINWDFKKMNFDQVDPPVGEKIEEGGQDELQFV